MKNVDPPPVDPLVSGVMLQYSVKPHWSNITDRPTTEIIIYISAKLEIQPSSLGKHQMIVIDTELIMLYLIVHPKI